MKNIQRFGAVFVIITVTLLVYASALRNGFVWDDTALVLRDPLIRSWRLIPEGFQHHLFVDATASNFYRPIQRLVFTGNYAAFGFAPAGWHAASIAVHAGAAVALFVFLVTWWGRERFRWALGVSVLWTIHPLHTSAVTYVAGLADPLVALFGFSALALAWKSLANRPRLAWGAGGLFLLAILSKESGVMAMAIWLVMLGSQKASKAAWGRWIAIICLVFSVYFTLRLTAEKTPPPTGGEGKASTPSYVLVSRAVAEYAGLIVAPITLQMERDITPPPADSGKPGRPELTFIGLGIIIALGAVGWWSRRRVPEAALALLLAAVAYFPISNVIRLNATAAEHWLYIPSAYSFAAVALILRAVPLSTAFRTALAIAGCLWAGWLGVRTWQRQADWLDQRTFLTRTIAAGGASARMYLNLGGHELKEGHHEAALVAYQSALETGTSQNVVLLALANAQLRLGQLAEARATLSLCTETSFLAAELLQLRAALDHAEFQTDPAASYLAAAELTPLNWTPRRRYFTTLSQSGREKQAISELLAFLQEQDFRADSWLLLADLLKRTSQPLAAEEAYRQAQRRDVRLQR